MLGPSEWRNGDVIQTTTKKVFQSLICILLKLRVLWLNVPLLKELNLSAEKRISDSTIEPLQRSLHLSVHCIQRLKTEMTSKTRLTQLYLISNNVLLMLNIITMSIQTLNWTLLLTKLEKVMLVYYMEWYNLLERSLKDKPQGLSELLHWNGLKIKFVQHI